MSRPATTSGADRLIHCSPDRTLFVTSDGDQKKVCKVFVRGSMAQAEREVELGRQLQDLGVVRYREARLDPSTNRPCIMLDWHDGTDLDHLVAERGAIDAGTAANLLAPVARTLAAMHAFSTTGAPAGICHGDIKPANLLVTGETTLVLDLEHARAISTGESDVREVTGTPGFASPEARAGARPSAALDSYGLGTTLRWLLTGGGLSRLPQDAEVHALIAECTADDPARRPAADAIAHRLAAIARRLADDSEEAILARLLAGERIDFVSDLPRHAALQRLAGKQRRLLARFPELLTTPETVPAAPAALHLALHHVQRVLRHFPRHTGALQWRQRLAEAIRGLLADAAGTVASRQREERHTEAARWLEDTVRVTRDLLRLPGREPIPGDPRTAGMLQRDPIAFLERLQHQIAEAQAELDAATAAIDDAEVALDLPAAEAAIDAMAKRYGGSSPTAARRRDQLHRLAFFLDRIAGAQANVERLGQTWDRTALDPLARFVTDCSRSAYRLTRDDPTTPLGLRTLQVTLVNFAEEFPHLYVRSGPALEALTSALEHTSDLAWNQVAEASKQLDSVPVPVRPLQITLGRLDTLRILEALVDRPERPRSQLFDSIEGLRLKFEQARAARDRLAEGAEEAIARGHWTTGLFDMERAVAGLNPADDEEREEARRLEERLAEAREKKRELEAAVRRNVELGNLYGTLQDDAATTFDQRLEALIERRDCLQFLAANLPAERAQLYGSDLREVELQIALEQADRAENEFDATVEPGERLRLAEQTLTRLESSLTAAEFADEPPRRLLRLLDHWRTVAARCRRDEERRQREQQSRARIGRRSRAVAAAALLVVSAAGAWLVGPTLWSAVTAATHADSAQAEFSEWRARVALERSAMPAPLADAADRLRGSIAAAADTDREFELAAWHGQFELALRAFAAEPTARGLAEAGWRLGFVFASQRIETDRRTELRRLTDALADQLPGLEVPR